MNTIQANFNVFLNQIRKVLNLTIASSTKLAMEPERYSTHTISFKSF